MQHQKENCPNCKGKGHILDAIPAALIVGFGWVLSMLEKNDPNGITRRPCEFCDATGKVMVDR